MRRALFVLVALGILLLASLIALQPDPLPPAHPDSGGPVERGEGDGVRGLAELEPADEPEAGKVIFRSDFDEWDPRWEVNRGDQNTVWLDGNGHLVMGISKDADGNLRQSRVDTGDTFTFRYGTIRFRMRFLGPRGAHAAGWVQHLGEPQHTEIDVVENFGSNRNVFQTLWWCPIPCAHPTEQYQRGVDVGDVEVMHNYRIDWWPGRYVLIIDGQTVAQTGEGLSHHPKQLILSYLVSAWELPNLQQDSLGQYRAYVEYVEVKANSETTYSGEGGSR